jgi:hypothetical protein
VSLLREPPDATLGFVTVSVSSVQVASHPSPPATPPSSHSSTGVAGLRPDELEALRAYVSRHVDGPAAPAEPVPQSDRFRLAASMLTWTTATSEALLALAFLLPPGWALARRRDWLLLVFSLGTYVAIAPVEGFGWLLLALGAAQAEPTRTWITRAYVVVFMALIVSRGLR